MNILIHNAYKSHIKFQNVNRAFQSEIVWEIYMQLISLLKLNMCYHMGSLYHKLVLNLYICIYFV